jgi:murein DD-endopeptidase MepM/ murein hydrolase activator NlpD
MKSKRTEITNISFSRIVRLSFLLLFALALTINAPFVERVSGQSKFNASDKDQLEQQMKRVKILVNRKNLEKKGISAQFNKLDKELNQTRRQLNNKTSELRSIEQRQAQLDRQLAETTAKYGSYRQQHKSRLVTYYKNGHVGYLEVLFNSSSFSDFISRVYYLKLLTQHDLEVMGNLQQTQRQIQSISSEMEEKKIQAQHARDMLQMQRAQVATMVDMKKKALDEVSRDIKLLEREYRELEEENRRIERELQAARGTGPQHKFTGAFGSPVCGRSFEVSSSYGPRRAPIRGASTYHRGIDVRASYGADICASADGTVIQSSYRKGYGNTVIIKHGSDYSTVYAHALRNLVIEGQQVKKGQVIQKADSTGISTGNHLHFEIRLNGVAVDPMGYLR